MEDYFDMLQKAAARNAAHKSDGASNGHDNTSSQSDEDDTEEPSPTDRW